MNVKTETPASAKAPRTRVIIYKQDLTWSRIHGLNVYHLDGKPATTSQFFRKDELPEEYRWAYRHIIDHDCGSISCGKTVFEVVYNDLCPRMYLCADGTLSGNRADAAEHWESQFQAIVSENPIVQPAAMEIVK